MRSPGDPQRAGHAWQTPLVPALAAAFFDLDKTVIARASVIAFSRPFYREGLLTRRILARGLWSQLMFLRFGARAQALDRMKSKVLRVTEGWEQERVRRVVSETLAQVVAPITYSEALELIAEHKAGGRRVYIVSAAPEEIVEPLAGYLGADGAIGTQAMVRAGRYTGQLLSYSYGPHKADQIRRVAERDQLDLSASWAYSDSATDVPMLEAVGHPVAVNPDRALRRIARMRGWPVLQFSELNPAGPQGAGAVRLAAAAAIGSVVLGATATTVFRALARRRPASSGKGLAPRTTTFPAEQAARPLRTGATGRTAYWQSR